MQRRTLALALLGILLIGGLATAVVLRGPERVELVRPLDQRDHVTLYQNGLAFVVQNRTFVSPGGESHLVVPVAPGARLDSLRIEGEGVVVKQFLSGIPEDASLQPGDELVVHTSEGKTFAGSFVRRDGAHLVLATATGLTFVGEAQVLAIELAGRTVRAGHAPMEYEVLVEAPPGTHTIRVSYLAEGAGWTPSYELDVETGEFAFFATLTGLDAWSNVTLDLVSGSPHVVMRYRPYEQHAPRMMSYDVKLSVESGASVRDEVGSSAALGELHRYRYDRPLDVARGQTVRILVEEGQLDVERHYHEASAYASQGWGPATSTPVQVLERLQLRNTLGEPLPSGVVLARRDGTWIAEDTLPATAKGQLANITLAQSYEVRASLLLERVERDGAREIYHYALTVDNQRAHEVDLRAALSFPSGHGSGTRLLATTPAAEESGGLAVWNDMLSPSESTTLRLRYEWQPVR